MVKILLLIINNILLSVVSFEMYCGQSNCYDLLGVNRDEIPLNPSLIRKSFRTLSMRFHPDKVILSENEDKEKVTDTYAKIVNAYEILSDKDVKEDYDYYLDHPEEFLHNSYRFYRRHISMQFEVKQVVFGVIIAITILQIILHYENRNREILAFSLDHQTQRYINNQLRSYKKKNKQQKKKQKSLEKNKNVGNFGALYSNERQFIIDKDIDVVKREITAEYIDMYESKFPGIFPSKNVPITSLIILLPVKLFTAACIRIQSYVYLSAAKKK